MAKWCRHAKAAAPTGLAVVTTETNSAGSLRMGQATGIEWCDHTYNPWMGCTKVSPACDHCYAEAQEDARYGRVEWGGPRRRTSEATRRAPYRWDREAAATGERRRVFCMSLGDFWDNQVPDEWRIEALNMIRQCRNLDWLILTKRPQNILKMLPPDWGRLGWSHVWLGATVENMTEARRRIPILLRVPARVHWLSVAPLLEPLDLRPWLGRGIDWIVVGGETGAKDARYMEPDWARDLRDQCSDTGVALFLKQMWKRQPIPADLMVREYPGFDRFVGGDNRHVESARLGYSLRSRVGGPPLPAPPRRSCRRSLGLRRSLLPCLDLTFEERPLMAINGASDPIVRLAIFHRQ